MSLPLDRKTRKGPWRTRTAAPALAAEAEAEAAEASAPPEPPPPFLSTVGWALALHIGVLAAAIVVSYWSGYYAAAVALLGAIVVTARGPAPLTGSAMFIAAATAGIGGALAAFAHERARELGAGEIVRDIAVSAAPEHPRATGFVFRDVRVLAGQAGSHHHVTYSAPTSTSRSSKRETYYVVAPLVAPSWRTGDLIPAWAACATGREANCMSSLAKEQRLAAVTVPRQDLEYYSQAVAAAIRGHGLSASPGAPVVRLVDDDPARVGWFQRVRTWLVQPLAFALFLTLFGGWRAWRRFRRPSAGA